MNTRSKSGLGKCFFMVLMSLFSFASCINNSGSANSITVKGRFIKIIRTDDGLFKILLKLKNDSIVGFKTEMSVDAPEIELFKNGGMEIEVVYKEYKDPTTNAVEKIIQSIHPVYNLTK